jgi:hypothetical protein
MSRNPLTDYQIWVLVQADQNVADIELACSVGTQVSTIHAARWRLRKHGWTCRVSFGTCRYCSKPFTGQGHKAGRREYHPACYQANKKDLTASHDKRRWKCLSGSEKAEIFEQGHRHTAKWQEVTKDQATNHMRRWQNWEDELILATNAPTDFELALDLGRSLLSVRGRRRDLKKRKPSSRRGGSL